MLTLKELNDRTYREISDQSKELIPRIFPQWTDLRAHDPGITFVELFSWLVEMLEEYLNKVTLRNRLKFLKLLNARPGEPQRASACVTLESTRDMVIIPEGTRLLGENIVFETCETISLNGNQEVKAAHGRTLSKVYYFSGTDDRLSVHMDGYLPYFGICEVKVRRGDYWYLWGEKSREDMGSGGEVYWIDRDEDTMNTTIVFGKEMGNVKGQELPNIMVTAYEKAFAKDRQVDMAAAGDKTFRQDGRLELKRALPNQVIRLDWAVDEELIYPGSFRIQVGELLYGEKDYRWRDFERVDDFLNSKGSDPHFVFDYQKREIHFGNNENGTMPKGILGNIIQVVSCTIGCGSKGNIRENILNKVDMAGCLESSEVKPNDQPGHSAGSDAWENELVNQERHFIRIKGHGAAIGGHDGESLDEAVKTLLLNMKKQYRAVTEKDYEDAVLSAPGLKVARAKALPEFVKGQKNYPQSRSPGQLTLAVLPLSNEKMPVPDDAFIERINKHLDQMRLITTQVHVIPPLYIGVGIRCAVAVMPHINFEEKTVISLLEEFLSPVNGKDSSGWPFGGTVRKGDIISKISALEGVEYVKDVQINSDGDGVRLDKSGDLLIPPYALVYSKKHQVVILKDE